MTFEEYYGKKLRLLEDARQYLLELVKQFPDNRELEEAHPIMYCTSRIKSPDSMIKKLTKMGLEADPDTALREMHDAVGLRIVCSFADNVYEVADWLCGRTECRVIEKKDYIAYPKPNGYRSLHLILLLKEEKFDGLSVEIQLRTIAIDFWAALEHQIKYKRYIEHEPLVREELKRCADEIASVDLSMQTIRDMIRENIGEEEHDDTR
ncbi:MAG: RelA/SpoT domain protein [Clostridiales bacterium]|nr:RelA/SpoT domain protein [Clostridiales bacterium]